MKKVRVQNSYQDFGFGFPVTLLHVPMVQIRGEWVPNINQKLLQKRVIQALVEKPTRLSGQEVRFIRMYSQMTLIQFANRFAVTHPAVMKWEKMSAKSTGMNWATEKDIRLFALGLLDPKPATFMDVYEKLIDVADEKSTPIEIDLDKRSA